MLYEFGARLLKLRKAKKLTQQAIVDRAKALDPDLRLSDAVLGKYESDLAVPRLTEAAAIAGVLGVSLDYLTSGETYRTLPLKDLSEEQIQILLDLGIYFRQQNGGNRKIAEKVEPTAEQVVLIAQLIKEILN